MKTSESIKAIAPAFLKAQRKIGAALKDAKNPFYKSNYADLGSVMEAIKVPLNDEGIAISQNIFSDSGLHYVETILLHESGEFLSSGAMKLELNKVDMQQFGAASTYAKRYQLQAMGFVPSADDDAESTMNRPAKAAPAPSKPALVPTETITTKPVPQTPTESYGTINKADPTPTRTPEAPKSGFGGFKASKPKTELF